MRQLEGKIAGFCRVQCTGVDVGFICHEMFSFFFSSFFFLLNEHRA